jgi:hypothetical protein
VPARRVRGFILRLVRRRAAATAAGLALAAPAAWLEVGRPIDAWWVDGLSLILGATGVALVWIGAVGVTPDWIDET